MKVYKYCFTAMIIALLCCTTTMAQESALRIRMDVNDADGILINRNNVQAFLDIENTDSAKIDFTTSWAILTDDHKPWKMMTLSHTILPNQSLRADCPLFRFPGHGFYRIQVKVRTTEPRESSFERVIGISPENISAPIDKQADFDEFWEKALTELAQVPPEYNITPVNREGETKTHLYRVEMKSYGGTTVRGWLELPKKKGVYPALLRVPGYQENMEPIDVANDMIVFSFNTRDHGESDDSESGPRSWDMWVRGLDSKDEYYYKGLFLDCIRAVDFLASRADVDKDRIAIWGGSQGGGLSFSTAALDSRIALCIADIPYMCDYPSFFEITYWKEVDQWFERHPAATWQTVLNTLSYYDTKNMADKITCPVWMGIGLQDDICPPSTSFITYNRIESNKNYVVYKNEKHSQPEAHYTNRFKQLREFFGIEE